MKNISVIISVFLIVFSSCKEKKTVVEDTSQPEKAIPAKDAFKTDSVEVNDSLKVTENLMAKFKMKSLVFPNIDNKALLDSIYAGQNLNAQQYSETVLKVALNAKKDEFFSGTKESLKDWSPDFPQTWEQNSAMKVFSKLNDYMVVQYTSDGYTGGAHGYYNELYSVFDLNSKKKLQLSDLVKNTDAAIWARILMSHFLQQDLERGQAEMLLVKDIPLNKNFYFDAENLYFLYNQYEIAAYAAGPILIKVPFTEIKPMLTTDFRARLNLK